MVTRVPADVGPAMRGSSNRWKSARSVRQRLGRRRVVGRRIEQGGILEDHERVPRQVGGQARGPLARPDQWQHGELLDGLDGALAGRIEDAQRLDLVAEELRPHRPLLGGREDVDDAAPQAPLPDLRDGVDALVARPLERLRAAPRARCSGRAPETGSGRGTRGAARGAATAPPGSSSPPPPRRSEAGGSRARAPHRARDGGRRATRRVARRGTRAPGWTAAGHRVQRTRQARRRRTRRRGRSGAGRPRSRGSPGWGRPVSRRRAASTSAREEPQSPTACAQSTPSARADDSSPSAAHRDNMDSEADTLIRNCYPDTRLRVPSNPRHVKRRLPAAPARPSGGRAPLTDSPGRGRSSASRARSTSRRS